MLACTFQFHVVEISLCLSTGGQISRIWVSMRCTTKIVPIENHIVLQVSFTDHQSSKETVTTLMNDVGPLIPP